MNPNQFTNLPYYYLIYYYRKAIPKNPFLYYLYLVIKFISVYLITHNIESSTSEIISISTLLEKISFTSKFISSQSMEYSSLSLIINGILIIIVVIILVYINLIKTALKNSDSARYKIPNSKFNLSKKAKIFLKFFIYFYCTIVFFSHFIIEFLCYSYFFIYHTTSNQEFAESHLILINHYKQRIIFNEYFLCVINSIGIIIVLMLSYFFLLYSSYKTMTPSFGVQVYSTHKRIIAMLIIFHLHVVYSISSFFIPVFCRKIRFSICLIMMLLLLIILLLHYNVYNISTSTFGLFVCFLCDWCLISSIIMIIIYISNINAKNIHMSFYTMKIVFEVCNAIFISIGIMERNKSVALSNFQKCLFSNIKVTSLNYSLYEYFILVQKSCENRKSSFVWFYDFIISHKQFCTNENCECQQNTILNSITPQSDPELLVKVLILIGEELIVSSINRQSPSQSKIIEEYYLLHVDFLISIKKKYLLSLYLCQYYLFQKSDRIGFLYGYYLYEINKLIFTKFKGKCLNSNDQNNQIVKNQRKMNERINSPKHLLNEQFTIDKIQQMIYHCINQFEQLMNFRLIKNSKKKITFTGNDTIQPLKSFLDTREELLKLITEYTFNQKYATVEIYYIITYSLSFLYDNKTKKKFKRFIPHVKNYEIGYNAIERMKCHFIILFLDQNDKFVVKYASINLIEKLSYKKKDFIGIDFNELLPKEITNEHFAEMKKFLVNKNTKYEKETFLLTKNMNIFQVKVKCNNFPTISHFFSMILKISPTKKNEEEDMIYYNLLINESFKFISTSLSFEKQFFFSIKMLDVLKIDFCQLFGLSCEGLKNKFKNQIAKQKESLEKIKKPLESSILTSIKQEYHHLYDYTINYNTKKQNRASMVVTEIISKNKTLNEIQKIEYNIQELEKEWKDRILDLYNRLRASKETQLSNDLNTKNTDFFIRIELKSIGYFFYYVVLIKEEVSQKEFHLNELSEFGTSPINRNGSNTHLKNPFAHHNFHISVKSFINLSTSSTNVYQHQSQTNLCQVLLKTPNTITSNINMISSSIPNSSATINNSNSKINLFSHDIKLLQIDQRKTILQPQKDGNETKINKYKLIQMKISKWLKIIKCINYGIFLVVLILIVFNFLYNKTTTEFSVDLFNVNSFSFLIKSDIYFSSLAVITSCLIKDKIRQGDFDYFLNTIKARANQLLVHYNQLLTNINCIADHYQADVIYNLLYSEESYDLLNSDWTYYQRKSSFGEEVYFMHMSLVQFDLNPEDSKCRIKEHFFNRKFFESSSRENEIGKGPSSEEKYLFFIIYNVINKLSAKMDELTTKTIQIVKEFNTHTEYITSILNWAIFTFGVLLYSSIFSTIALFHYKFKYNMIKLFEQKKYDDLLRFKLSMFKKLIEDFGKSECKLFEESIQSKKINLDTLTNDTKQSIKKLSSTNNSFQINNSKECQNNAILAKNLMNNEEIFLSDKDFKKVISLQRGKTLTLFNSLFLICFLIVQIETIIFKQHFFGDLFIQNDFAINYLSRIPKFGELELYALISVILNDMNYITTKYEDYNKIILANYYNVTLNILSDSLFQRLGDSHFTFIYYQLYITRTNIQLFTYDSDVSEILRQTKNLEILFNTKNNFCIYMPYYYVLQEKADITVEQTLEIFSEISNYTNECRVTCNGINLSGSKASADLVITQLCDIYAEYFKIELDKRDPIKFFNKPSYLYIDDNLQKPLKKLHNVNSYFIDKEIEVFYKRNQLIDIAFAFAIMFTSCGFILILIFLLRTRIEEYCNIVVEINDLLDNVLLNMEN